jgi:ABC-type lipoprotein release transport system permease subunit
VRIGDWKYLETNYSYTWPIPLEHPSYVTKDFVSKYSPADRDTAINRLDNWPKLFYLKENAAESYNLYSRQPEKAAKMKQTLSDFRTNYENNPRGWFDH